MSSLEDMRCARRALSLFCGHLQFQFNVATWLRCCFFDRKWMKIRFCERHSFATLSFLLDSSFFSWSLSPYFAKQTSLSWWEIHFVSSTGRATKLRFFHRLNWNFGPLKFNPTTLEYLLLSYAFCFSEQNYRLVYWGQSSLCFRCLTL